MIYKYLKYLGLVVLALIFCCVNVFAQGEDEDDIDRFDREIYNEVIDTRSEEEKMSPQERRQQLLDQLKETMEQKAAEQQGEEQQEEPEGQPQRRPRRRPGRPDQPGGPGPASTVPGGQGMPGGPIGPAVSGGDAGSALENRPTLGIYPASVSMEVGEEWIFEIRLDNPDSVPFDALGILIGYDPIALEVLDSNEELSGVNINDASAAQLGLTVSQKDFFYRNEVNVSQGQVEFRARSAGDGQLLTSEGVVAKIRVKALRERGTTSLEFRQIQAADSLARLTERSNRGEVNGTFLRMYLKNDRERLASNPVLSFSAQIRVLPGEEGSAFLEADFFPTALQLKPSKPTVEVGEMFDVLLTLVNPQHVEFDALSCYLKYDTRALEVVDSDEGNLITSGINVQDGEFQDKFSFDFCRANRVDPEEGEIEYAMESLREPLSGTGVFARVRFRALRPVESTRLLFGFNPTGGFPTTGVTRRQVDVLASKNDRRDGIASSSISIVSKQK